MLCLEENDSVYQSSSNLPGSHVDGIGHDRMLTCSNGMLCKKKVLVLVK